MQLASGSGDTFSVNWQNDKHSLAAGKPVAKGFIMLQFYTPPPKDPWMNRVVAMLDGPFSHVELVFHDGMASSIYAGEEVFFKKRTFSNPNYTTLSICLTEEQELLARDYCYRCSLSKKDAGFDSMGMYGAALPDFIRKCIQSSMSIFQKNASHRGVENNSIASTESQDSRAEEEAHLNMLHLSRLTNRAGLNASLKRKSASMRVDPVQFGKTFCSKHVASALRYAGVEPFKSIQDTGSISPSSMYRMIADCPQTSAILAMTPHKQKMLMERGTA